MGEGEEEMTIGVYIVRMIVALILGISFVVASLMWYESHYWETKPDLANYISLIIFMIFAWLLWIIK